MPGYNHSIKAHLMLCVRKHSISLVTNYSTPSAICTIRWALCPFPLRSASASNLVQKHQQHQRQQQRRRRWIDIWWRQHSYKHETRQFNIEWLNIRRHTHALAPSIPADNKNKSERNGNTRKEGKQQRIKSSTKTEAVMTKKMTKKWNKKQRTEQIHAMKS